VRRWVDSPEACLFRRMYRWLAICHGRWGSVLGLRIEAGGEDLSWFGCVASEGRFLEGRTKRSAMVIACFPQAESRRRWCTGEEDSGESLCCSRDAAAGDGATAVVRRVSFLPDPPFMTQLPSVVVRATTGVAARRHVGCTAEGTGRRCVLSPVVLGGSIRSGEPLLRDA
jgi:hypothetical protein